jgi:hypothetical protein
MTYIFKRNCNTFRFHVVVVWKTTGKKTSHVLATNAVKFRDSDPLPTKYHTWHNQTLRKTLIFIHITDKQSLILQFFCLCAVMYLWAQNYEINYYHELLRLTTWQSMTSKPNELPMPDYKVTNVDGSKIHLPSLLGLLEELTRQPTFVRLQYNYYIFAVRSPFCRKMIHCFLRRHFWVTFCFKTYSKFHLRVCANER